MPDIGVNRGNLNSCAQAIEALFQQLQASKVASRTQWTAASAVLALLVLVGHIYPVFAMSHVAASDPHCLSIVLAPALLIVVATLPMAVVRRPGPSHRW